MMKMPTHVAGVRLPGMQRLRNAPPVVKSRRVNRLGKTKIGGGTACETGSMLL